MPSSSSSTRESQGFDLKEQLEAWRSLPYAAAAASMYYPYDGHAAAMAGYPFPNTYGMDLNGARRKNATRETTSMLKAWLSEHRKNPYPTKGEKIMLAIVTKMTLTQVSTWFANARRRLKKENKMTWSPRNRCEEDEAADAEAEKAESGGGSSSARRSGSESPAGSASVHNGESDRRRDRSPGSPAGHQSRRHHRHHHHEDSDSDDIVDIEEDSDLDSDDPLASSSQGGKRIKSSSSPPLSPLTRANGGPIGLMGPMGDMGSHLHPHHHHPGLRFPDGSILSHGPGVGGGNCCPQLPIGFPHNGSVVGPNGVSGRFPPATLAELQQHSQFAAAAAAAGKRSLPQPNHHHPHQQQPQQQPPPPHPQSPLHSHHHPSHHNASHQLHADLQLFQQLQHHANKMNAAAAAAAAAAANGPQVSPPTGGDLKFSHHFNGLHPHATISPTSSASKKPRIWSIADMATSE